MVKKNYDNKETNYTMQNFRNLKDYLTENYFTLDITLEAFLPSIKNSIAQKALGKGGLGFLTGETYAGYGKINERIVGAMPLYKYYVTSDGAYTEINWDKTDGIYPLQEKEGNNKPFEFNIEFNKKNYIVKTYITFINGCKILLFYQDKFYKRIYPNEPYKVKQMAFIGEVIVEFFKIIGSAPDIIRLNEPQLYFVSVVMENDINFFENKGTHSIFEETNLIVTTHTPEIAALYPYNNIDWLEKQIGVDLISEKDLDEGVLYLLKALAKNPRVKIINGVSKEHAEVTKLVILPEKKEKIIGITNGSDPDQWKNNEVKEIEKVKEISGEDLFICNEIGKEKLNAYFIKELGYGFIDLKRPLVGLIRRLVEYKEQHILLDIINYIIGDRNKKYYTPLGEKNGLEMNLLIGGEGSDKIGAEWVKIFKALILKKEYKGKFIFIEETGIDLMKLAVSASNIWISMPRTTREAAGTSQQRAAVNGGLNIATKTGESAESIETGKNGWLMDVFMNSGFKFKDIVKAMNIQDNNFDRIDILVDYLKQTEEIVDSLINASSNSPFSYLKTINELLEPHTNPQKHKVISYYESKSQIYLTSYLEEASKLYYSYIENGNTKLFEMMKASYDIFHEKMSIIRMVREYSELYKKIRKESVIVAEMFIKEKNKTEKICNDYNIKYDKYYLYYKEDTLIELFNLLINKNVSSKDITPELVKYQYAINTICKNDRSKKKAREELRKAIFIIEQLETKLFKLESEWFQSVQKIEVFLEENKKILFNYKKVLKFKPFRKKNNGEQIDGFFAPIGNVCESKDKDWGRGNFQTLYKIVDLASKLGFNIVQTFPLTKSSYPPYHYSIESSIYKDPINLCIDWIVEDLELLTDENTIKKIKYVINKYKEDNEEDLTQLRKYQEKRGKNNYYTIDYQRVEKILYEGFQIIWSIVKKLPERSFFKSALKNFIKKKNYDANAGRENLLHHTLYIVLKEKNKNNFFGENWWSWRSEWPDSVKDKREDVIKALEYFFNEEIMFHMWLQQMIEWQLRRVAGFGCKKNVELMDDLGYNLEGADVFLKPHLFCLKKTKDNKYVREFFMGAGVSSSGRNTQLWQGFPWNWKDYFQEVLRSWKNRIINDNIYFGTKRLDHGPGFFRYMLFQVDLYEENSIERLGIPTDETDPEKLYSIILSRIKSSPALSRYINNIFDDKGDIKEDNVILVMRSSEKSSDWSYLPYYVEYDLFTDKPAEFDFLRISPLSKKWSEHYNEEKFEQLEKYMKSKIRPDDQIIAGFYEYIEGDLIMKELLQTAVSNDLTLVSELLGAVPKWMEDSIKNIEIESNKIKIYSSITRGLSKDSDNFPANHIKENFINSSLADGQTLYHKIFNTINLDDFEFLKEYYLIEEEKFFPIDLLLERLHLKILLKGVYQSRGEIVMLNIWDALCLSDNRGRINNPEMSANHPNYLLRISDCTIDDLNNAILTNNPLLLIYYALHPELKEATLVRKTLGRILYLKLLSRRGNKLLPELFKNMTGLSKKILNDIPEEIISILKEQLSQDGIDWVKNVLFNKIEDGIDIEKNLKKSKNLFDKK